jgi:hypothetical protein
MELTKRRKPKPEESSTERLEEEEKDNVDDKEYFNLAELSKNKNQSNEDKEIQDDFYNFNKKGTQHFSEISSTIHFTALNSKDLAISKYKFVSGGLNLQYSKSISIVNVLDELNKNPGGNFINDGVLQKNLNLSILDNTKLIMPKSNRNNSQTNYNININSYVIANRTHSNQILTVDLHSKDNNDALIHSESISTQNDFIVENIFNNVEKIGEPIDIRSKEGLVKQTAYINYSYTPVFNPKEINTYKDVKRENQVMYPEELDGVKIEWKRYNYNIISKLQNVTQGSANNCSLIAAIVSILNYDKMFNKAVFNSIFYPYKVK